MNADLPDSQLPPSAAAPRVLLLPAPRHYRPDRAEIVAELDRIQARIDKIRFLLKAGTRPLRVDYPFVRRSLELASSPEELPPA